MGWACEICKFEAVQDTDLLCKACKEGFNTFVPKGKYKPEEDYTIKCFTTEKNKKDDIND